jgi:amino-acid N-acetyltransferase
VITPNSHNTNPPKSEPAFGSIYIRRARLADVPMMAKIINDAAEFGLMLHKPLSALYENVREFQVAVRPIERGTYDLATPGNKPENRPQDVVGVCGLSIVWANLAELVSLAVSPGHRGKGLGRKLVEACMKEARELGVRRIMSLTYEQRFFEKLGFVVVQRDSLPHKVWAECVRCPKHEACDEIAMVKVLEDVPENEAPAPPVSSSYDVPIVLTSGGKRMVAE